MICPRKFGTAANRSDAETVGVTKGNLGSEDGFAIFHFHQRHSVLTPDLPKGVTFGKQRSQPFAIARHCFRADGVQRQQDVIGSLPKVADPVPRITWSRITHQFRARSRTGDKRTEGIE